MTKLKVGGLPTPFHKICQLIRISLYSIYSLNENASQIYAVSLVSLSSSVCKKMSWLHWKANVSIDLKSELFEGLVPMSFELGFEIVKVWLKNKSFFNLSVIGRTDPILFTEAKRILFQNELDVWDLILSMLASLNVLISPWIFIENEKDPSF